MKIKTLSVSEVNNYIKKILDNDFILNNLSVKGEISNLKHHSSGHIYFSLKDRTSKINCIMFKSNAENLDFILEEGMEVIISGRASVYTVTGSFQLYCNDIQKQGIGDLYHKFNQLKEKLSKEGYFDDEHKQSLPINPQRIGIVTSPTGAAIEDIKNVIRRRNSKLDIVLYPALVQGKDAYKTIIDGIKYFNKKQSVDVIIIGRGGGSIEELWNFNEEKLAFEIFKSKIPIISAVGHEVDFTISDFISDIRAATPSQAAEIVSPLESELYKNIEFIKEKLHNIIDNRLNYEKSNLSNYSRILELNSPMNKVLNGYLEVDALKDRLNYAMKNKVEKEKDKLFSLNNILQAKNPINILGRGYAIIKGEQSILKSKDDFKEKEDIEIVLHDGSVKGTFTLYEIGGDL